MSGVEGGCCVFDGLWILGHFDEQPSAIDGSARGFVKEKCASSDGRRDGAPWFKYGAFPWESRPALLDEGGNSMAATRSAGVRHPSCEGWSVRRIKWAVRSGMCAIGKVASREAIARHRLRAPAANTHGT